MIGRIQLNEYSKCKLLLHFYYYFSLFSFLMKIIIIQTGMLPNEVFLKLRGRI